MTQEEIKSFSKKHKWKFKRSHLKEIEKWLVDAGDQEMLKIEKAIKSPTKINALAFFLNMLAADRFALGQPIIAIMKLIWIWGFAAGAIFTGIFYLWIVEGIWPLIDWITAPFRAKNYNYKKVKAILNINN